LTVTRISWLFERYIGMRLWRTRRIRLTAILVVAVTLVTAGCSGGDLTQIEGKLVRNDGTPLSGARVVLRSKQSGKNIYGYTNNNGEIRLEVPDEEPRDAARDYDVMIVEGTGDPDNRRPATIAPKYLDATKSGLKVTVQPKEKNRFEFKLDAR
jgi:hypothetical protein